MWIRTQEKNGSLNIIWNFLGSKLGWTFETLRSHNQDWVGKMSFIFNGWYSPNFWIFRILDYRIDPKKVSKVFWASFEICIAKKNYFALTQKTQLCLSAKELNPTVVAWNIDKSVTLIVVAYSSCMCP